MQAPIAQVIALTVTGNAFLQGKDIGRFWPEGSTFQFCSTVQFDVGPGHSNRLVANSPLIWFDYLRSFSGLRLHALTRDMGSRSGLMGVGFVGGIRWVIETIGGNATECWEGVWRRGDREAPDRRIWTVDYHHIQDLRAPLAEPLDSLTAARDRLALALEAIEEFAAQNALGFVDYFRNGLSALTSDQPMEHAYHKDLAPPDFLKPLALRLIAACQAAWVFGGMGWWNDGAYGGELAPEGDPLSKELFEALQQALVAAANSSFSPAE